MDVMAYIFMVAILIALVAGGWVLYRDRKRGQP